MTSRGPKVASIVWALLIGAGILALAGSVLLPSTKRSRIDFDKLRHQTDQGPATTEPASGPGATTGPETSEQPVRQR
jgi:hypothetical protein